MNVERTGKCLRNYELITKNVADVETSVHIGKYYIIIFLT